MDSDRFKRALGSFASGVTAVTVRTEEGQDHGMTASAFSSLSLDPPLVLVCVKVENSTHEHLEKASGFAINLLGAGQQALSNRFAGGIVDGDGQWSPWPAERDKFEDLHFSRGEASGAALLDGALACLDCSSYEALGGGDHTIFVGRVEGIRFPEDADPEPLVYFQGQYRKLDS